MTAEQVLEPEAEVRDELDVLDPQPSETVVLSSGLEVRIQPLKARQFFKLLRIITRGGAHLIQQLQFSMAADSPEDFAAQLIAVVVFAIPEADQEAIDFVRAMVDDPHKTVAHMTEGRRGNQIPVYQIDVDFDNPELDDLITVIEQVILREKEDLSALGKRLSKMLKLAERTGQLDKDTPDSLETSPEPLTPSVPSTAGATKRSSSSRSPVSAKPSTPSVSVASPTTDGSDST